MPLQFVVDAGGENIDERIRTNSYNVSLSEDLDEFHALLCVRKRANACFHSKIPGFILFGINLYLLYHLWPDVLLAP